jgi:hypothetical protein
VKSGKPFIVILLICSLALAGVSRNWTWELREAAAVDPLLPSTGVANGGNESTSSLSNMDSYALALLLGGLRGPLVMFLWSSSEAQKSAHDLEDFDTKVEWIRLLQPEFDTVHLFQIWNKAYNVSVQMSNLPNKYAAILDALDYAASVDRQRPDDIDITYAVAGIYGDKLGNSHEAPYYIQRVRQETRAPRAMAKVTMPDAKLSDFLAAAHAAGMDEPSSSIEADDASKTVTITLDGEIADQLKPAFSGPDVTFVAVPKPKPMRDTAIKRVRLDAMLDENGNLLASKLAPTHPRPATLAADAEWYDGSELQFLKQYEPFPYGLSPQAIAYNYYKRSQMLQRVAHEQHIQSSTFVIDSRPALGLEFWSAQQAEDGRRAELRLFGIDDQGERLSLELRAPGADPSVATGWAAALANRPDPAAGPRALYDYAMAARLAHDERAEFDSDILLFPRSQDEYMSHLDDSAMFEALYSGDHDFLEGVLNPPARTTSWASAAGHYQAARQKVETEILHYYVDDAMAMAVYPIDPGTGQPTRRDNVDRLTPQAREALIVKVQVAGADFYKTHENQEADDRQEYLTYLSRCVSRLRMMGGDQSLKMPAPGGIPVAPGGR